MEVTACLVTRGDVSIERWLESIPKGWDRVVYDNSMEAGDLKVYGRYEAIERAMTDVVFVQDDDCILPPESFKALTAAYTPGVLTANMPAPFREHYTDSCLIGFGAIFDKDLPFRAFNRITNAAVRSLPDFAEQFGRTCDVYFTALTPDQTWLDVPYENLPWATADTRMYRQPSHVGERAKALEHARRLRS